MVRELLTKAGKYLVARGWKWVTTRGAGATAAIVAGWFTPWTVTGYVLVAVVFIGGLGMAAFAYQEAVAVAHEANENAAAANVRAARAEKLAMGRSTSPSPLPRSASDATTSGTRGRHSASE